MANFLHQSLSMPCLQDLKYTFCIPAEGKAPPQKGFPASDGEAPVLEIWECGVPLHHHFFKVYSYSEW